MVQVTSTGTNTQALSSRVSLRTSSGVPYVVVYDGSGNIQMWKGNSTTPTSFSEQDASNAPNNSNYYGCSAAIDSSNVIHVSFWNNDTAMGGTPGPMYATFSTSTDTWTTEVLSDMFDEWMATSHNVYARCSIAVDSNDVPHIAYVCDSTNMGSAYKTVAYTNKVGGSWNTSIEVEGATASKQCVNPELSIDSDNLPVIAYSNSSDYDAGTAIGNVNNATSFTLQDVSTDQSTGATANDVSIAVDSGGNHWVAFKDQTNGYVNIIKHTYGAAWSSWGSVLNNTNVGDNPSLVIGGTDVYVFYEDSSSNVSYDMYDGSVWAGETDLQTGTFEEPRPKWAFWVDNDSSGTNVGLPSSPVTFVFDVSDAGPTDSGGVWTDDANAFNSDTSSVATTTTNGSTSTNFLQGDGTGAGSVFDNTITKVEARVYGYNNGAGGSVNAAIYTDGLGELLTTLTRTSSIPGWSTYVEPTTPTGGWTWAKIAALETKIYRTGGGATVSVGSVEIRVTFTENSDATEIDYAYSNGTNVFWDSLSLSTTTTYSDTITSASFIKDTNSDTITSASVIDDGTTTNSDTIQSNSYIKQTYSTDGDEAVVDTYSVSNASGQSGFIYTGQSVGLAGQSFTGNGSVLTSAEFYLYRVSTPTGSIRAHLYDHTGTYGDGGEPTQGSSPLATSTNTVDPSTLTTDSGTETTTVFNFSPYTLTDGVKYCIVWEWYNMGDTIATDIVYNRIDNTTPTHDGNQVYSNNGTTWTGSSTLDQCFIVNGIPGFTSETFIKTLATEKTITSLSEIYKVTTNTETIDSDSNILASGSQTITSSSYIQKLGYEDSITSSSFILQTYSTGGQESVVDSYNESRSGAFNIGSVGVKQAAQSFTGDGGDLSKATFLLAKNNSPTGNAYAKLYAHSGTFGSTSVPTGSALATSDAFDASTLTASYTLTDFTFPTPYTLVNGTKYCIVLDGTAVGDSTNYMLCGNDGTSPTHDGNSAYYISSWSAQSQDLIFFVYAAGSGVTSDTYILGSGSSTIDTDSYILKTTSQTIDSDSFVFKTSSQTIDSDTTIVISYSKTLDSDSFILATSTDTVDSDSYVLATDSDTITSAAVISTIVTNSDTIDSDSFIFKSSSETISSDSWISKETTDTIDSDSFVLATSSETIGSDASIFDTSSETISSDSWLNTEVSETLDSDSYVKDTSSDTITSASIVLNPGNEGSITSASFIKRLAYSNTIDTDSYLLSSFTDTIDSDASLLVTSSDTVDTDSYLLASAIETIGSDATIFGSVTKTITSASYISGLAASESITSASWVAVEYRTADTDTTPGSYVVDPTSINFTPPQTVTLVSMRIECYGDGGSDSTVKLTIDGVDSDTVNVGQVGDGPSNYLFTFSTPLSLNGGVEHTCTITPVANSVRVRTGGSDNSGWSVNLVS